MTENTMTLSYKDKATLRELSEMHKSEGWGSPDRQEWERLTHPYSIDLLLVEIDSLKAHLSRPVSVRDEDVERAWQAWFALILARGGKRENVSDNDLMRAALEADRAGRGVDDQCYRYALDLATALRKKHYAKDAPHWEPCRDLLGVLTQIDNMTTGLIAQGNGGVRDEAAEEVLYAWQHIAKVSGSALLAGEKKAQNSEQRRLIYGEACTALIATGNAYYTLTGKHPTEAPQPDAEGGV